MAITNMLRRPVESLLPYLNTHHKISVLDVGARDLKISHKMASFGFNVTAIDPLFQQSIPTNIFCIESTLEEYTPSISYDCIIARLISHHIKKGNLYLLNKLSTLCHCGGLIYVTFFGCLDSHVQSHCITPICPLEIRRICAILNLSIINIDESTWYGPLYTGDKQYWHVFTCLLQKNKA